MLLECGDRQEARDRIRRLSLVQHVLVSVEILTLAPCTAFAASSG